MPFDRDTRVVPSNIVLDRGTVTPREGEIGGRNPQFAEMPTIAKLLLPLFLVSLYSTTICDCECAKILI